jgi:hypothetical protein
LSPLSSSEADEAPAAPMTYPRLSRERWCQLLLLVMAFACYGRVWTRGAYSDDFLLLSYATAHPYWQAVEETAQLSSRFSQGIMVPLVFRALSGSSPGAFHWAIFHAIALLLFSSSILLYNRILTILDVPWRVRLLAGLVFVLHPVKAEALLWPTNVFAYVLPAFIFLLGMARYFRIAREGRETVGTLLATFTIVLFTAFFTEQIPPLFALLVAVRLYFFGAKRRDVLRNLFCLSSVLVIFIITIMNTGAATRIARTGWVGFGSLAKHLLRVVGLSAAGFIEYSRKNLLDGHSGARILESMMSMWFLLALIPLALLMRQLWKELNKFHQDRVRRPLAVMGIGVLALLAPLSPFMVVKYDVPERGLYIPLLGFALAVAAAFELLGIALPRTWQKAMAVGILALFATAGIMIDQLDQNDFSEYWSYERKLVTQLESSEPDLPENAEISLSYIPRPSGSTPSLVNDFAFQGLLDWLFPNKGVKGSSLADFSTIFQMPSHLLSTQTPEFQPPSDHWVLIWDGKEFVRLTKVRLQASDSSALAHPSAPPGAGKEHSRIPSVELKALMYPVHIQRAYGAEDVLEIGWMMDLVETDLLLLNLSVVRDTREQNNLHLMVSTAYRDGKVQSVFEDLNEKFGYLLTPSAFHKSFFVPHASELLSLDITVKGPGGPICTETVALPDFRAAR